MVLSRCIHRFSSRSQNLFASTVSGSIGIKLAILTVKPSSRAGASEGHVLKWRATVVSLLWLISKIWPWNRCSRRFFVCPTYWIPQFLHDITYIK